VRALSAKAFSRLKSKLSKVGLKLH